MHEEENVGLVPIQIHMYIQCNYYTHVPEVTGSSVADEEENIGLVRIQIHTHTMTVQCTCT